MKTQSESSGSAPSDLGSDPVRACCEHLLQGCIRDLFEEVATHSNHSDMMQVAWSKAKYEAEFKSLGVNPNFGLDDLYKNLGFNSEARAS